MVFPLAKLSLLISVYLQVFEVHVVMSFEWEGIRDKLEWIANTMLSLYKSEIKVGCREGFRRRCIAPPGHKETLPKERK